MPTPESERDAEAERIARKVLTLGELEQIVTRVRKEGLVGPRTGDRIAALAAEIARDP